jgi:aminoglycoside phosphotransferase (APT) family kinase protein
MEPTEVARAINAAISIANALDLVADESIVVQNSNKLSLRLLPCDVFARVSSAGNEHAVFEVDLAQRLAKTESPVAVLDPRVEQRGYERDGFEVTFWRFYEPVTPELSPAAYANALACVHAGMRTIDMATPHFTDRVASAEQLVASRDLTPRLTDADRALLASTLRAMRQAISEHGAAEQILHGEPHPGNVISTSNGPLFVDLETCCRGPVEFDLAHVPQIVRAQYTGINVGLLDQCRKLVLAMVAAWRFDPEDQLPRGHEFGLHLLMALRSGPPWPTIDEVFARLGQD